MIFLNRARRRISTSSGSIDLLLLACGYWVPVLIAAMILILTAALDAWLPPTVLTGNDTVSGAGIAILTAIIGFLAIATLGISVSMSVVSTAVGRFQEKYIRLLVEDPVREALTALIMVAFTVALGDLTFLVTGMRPWLAVAVPLTMAVATFAAMLGFVRSRLELFTGRGIAEELLKRSRASRPSELALWQGDCGDDIIGLCRSDLGNGRALDAAGTLGVAFRLLATPEPSHRLGTQISELVKFAAGNREHNRAFLQAFLVLSESFILTTPDDPWCGVMLMLGAQHANMKFGEQVVAALTSRAASMDADLQASLFRLLNKTA